MEDKKTNVPTKFQLKTCSRLSDIKILVWQNSSHLISIDGFRVRHPFQLQVRCEINNHFNHCWRLQEHATWHIVSK